MSENEAQLYVVDAYESPSGNEGPLLRILGLQAQQQGVQLKTSLFKDCDALIATLQLQEDPGGTFLVNNNLGILGATDGIPCADQILAVNPLANIVLASASMDDITREQAAKRGIPAFDREESGPMITQLLTYLSNT